MFYPFEIGMNRNVFIRLIDFMFGMLFIEKIKAGGIKLVLGAGAVIILNLFFMNDKLLPFVFTTMGISIFIILAFLSEYILKGKYIECIYSWVAKYSYAIFLIHHVVLKSVQKRFLGSEFSLFDGIVLLVINIFLIMVCAGIVEKVKDYILVMIKFESKKKEN